MGAFSLESLLNENSRGMEMSEERKIDGKVELISIYSMIPSQENFYDTENIMDLVQSIKLCGLLQPILLTESDEENDMFDIVAGHRRREACKYLVEHEKMDKFKMVPCVVKEKKSETMDELALIMANRFRDKTDWEKMQEAIKVEKLINALVGEKRLDKNTREALKSLLNIDDDKKMILRDFVAQILNTSGTNVARYKMIYQNLSSGLMVAFQEDKISVSIAYECAGLNEVHQKECEKLLTDGNLSLESVKKIKTQEKENEPLPGQMSLIDDVNRRLEKHVSTFFDGMYKSEQNVAMKRDKKELLMILKAEYGNMGAERCTDEEEWKCDFSGISFDYLKSNKIMLTWSKFVDKLFEVLDKRGLSFYQEPERILQAPQNEPKPEKTEEQLYEEDQARIDRETEKKLEEMGGMPGEEKPKADTHDRNPVINVSTRQFGEAVYTNKPYIILKDEDYRMHDVITMKELVKSEPTGRYLTASVISVEREHTGITDGYCIVLFKIIERHSDFLKK